MRNITAQDVLDTSTWRPLLGIVQSKTVPVNVTTTENGTLQQQKVQGLMALFTDGDYNLAKVGLYFVVDIEHDNKNVTGYEVSVWGPGLMEGFMDRSDPRGEPIKIHGIGLDNLQAVLDEPMKVINSVSLTLTD
jgi:hypothetical protein